MTNESLYSKKEAVDLIHLRVSKLFLMKELPTSIKNEYTNKYEQYFGMYSSLEEMKNMSSSEDTVCNLIEQQAKVLKTWADFEMDIANRISNM